jgi:3alpha(or 20beta)-hydroxysteroid dehydrogenase
MAAGGTLDGKVALITGGAHGQGAAEGRLFASEGATVVLADVVDSDGKEVAAEVGGQYHHLDVSSAEEWDTVVGDIVATHGRLDILINNAGIFRNNRIVEETIEQWDQVIAVNQTGVFLGMRTGGKAMIDAGNGGAIVNISSVAGLEGIFGSVSYTASKWAVRGMTKVAAKEWGKHGIRVNSVHPGLIETPMTADLRAFNDPTTRAKAERNIPLGRVGQPVDIAWMVVFLASDESSYCSGQEFTVDGGVHA